jgi:uncharacterized protein (DUF1778 family)
MESTTPSKHDKLAGNRPKHRGGAPRKAIKKEKSIRVRLSATQYFLIDNKAKSAGMKISDWFRAAAIGAKVIARLSHEERLFMKDLSGMANNLNQLTRVANGGGLLSMARECMALMNKVNKILDTAFKDDGQNT